MAWANREDQGKPLKTMSIQILVLLGMQLKSWWGRSLYRKRTQTGQHWIAAYLLSWPSVSSCCHVHGESPLEAVLATRPCYHNRVIVARAEFRIHSSVNILICAIKAAFCLAFLLRAESEWEWEAWQDSSADSIAFNMNFISAQIIFVQFFYSQLKCLSSTIKPNSSTFPYRSRRWRTFSEIS